MVEQRFALAWDRPFLPGASTHVSLFDGGRDPLHVVASGHGAGDANALSDLLTTLRSFGGLHSDARISQSCGKQLLTASTEPRL